MKKIMIATLLAAVVLSACKRNFDPVITGVLSPVNFPKTEADFELYTLQAYKPFMAKWGYNDVAYQNMFFSPEYGHLVMFDLSSDLFNYFPEWGGFWDGFSRGDFTFLKAQDKSSHFEKVRYISRMTKVIGDLEAAAIGESKKKQLLAEARTGRAMAMYYLLHMYGPVPVILDPAKIGTEAEADLTRPPRAEYVNAVAADLRYAADNLVKAPSEYGRFNKGLALGMLMRLHLNEKEWAKAEAAGREIVTLGYSLVTDYSSLFKEATEKNNETIWAVSVDPSATGSDLLGNFNPLALYSYPSDFKGLSIDRGWAPNGAFSPTWQFYDSFDPNDKRRALMVPEYDQVSTGGAPNPTGVHKTRATMRGPVLMKYPDQSGTKDLQGNDIPVLRYADVLLMLAEAINQQTGPTVEAIGFINEVRQKHGGLGQLPPAATGSKAAFNDAILNERGWDLYFEGVRHTDLVRFGKWPAAIEAVGKINHGPSPLFPVPQYAIDVSAGTLAQTPGY